LALATAGTQNESIANLAAAIASARQTAPVRLLHGTIARLGCPRCEALWGALRPSVRARRSISATIVAGSCERSADGCARSRRGRTRIRAPDRASEKETLPEVVSRAAMDAVRHGAAVVARDKAERVVVVVRHGSPPREAP